MRVAAVDIGTNTVRLLLADAVRDSGVTELRSVQRHEIITKLGEGLDATGRLGDEPMARALRGLEHYSRLIAAADVTVSGGVATAATRSAVNGSEFTSRVTEALGFQPQVIDGIEEARLTFLGATAGLTGDRSYAVVDVGGGSTEFVVGSEFPTYATSIDVGSVRLTERLEALGLRDLDGARTYVDGLFAEVVAPVDPVSVLGCGGTFVTLAAIANGVTTSQVDRTGEVVLAFDDLVETVARLYAMDAAEIARLPAVPAARAEVLPAGAVCAERAVARLGGTAVRISVSDILDGVAIELDKPR